MVNKLYQSQETNSELSSEDILSNIRNTVSKEAEALVELAHHVGQEYSDAVNLILTCNGKVIVTGMGKSGIIARKIAATLSSTGTLAVFMHPGEAMHGDLGIVSAGDVILAIGKSGESEEINSILPVLKRIGAKLIAITANKESTLAKNSDIVLHAYSKNEACPHNLAPTSSTMVALAIGDALAIVLMKIKNFQPENFALYHPGGILGRRLLLKVIDVMIPLKRCPILDPKTTNMSDVIVALSNKGLGIVLFRQKKESGLDGILTDGDIRRLLETYRSDIFDLRLSDILNRSPEYVDADMLAVEVLRFMERREKPLNVLPVMGNGELRGVVRLHELVGKV